MRGFYAIIDPDHCGDRSPEQALDAVLGGGCAAVQLRCKQMDDGAMARLGSTLLPLARAAGVPFIINDRPQVALALGADGIHLGQQDMALRQARALVGSMLIGLSTHSPDQAQAAVEAGADLIGFGPVFPTATKLNPDPVVGLQTLARVCAQCPLPVVAIGGISGDTIEQVAQAGAPMAASIGAVLGAQDAAAAARQLHEALRQFP